MEYYISLIKWKTVFHGIRLVILVFIELGLKYKKWLKIDVKSIFNHEGGTQKIKVVAQNKAIQISFQMI